MIALGVVAICLCARALHAVPAVDVIDPKVLYVDDDAATGGDGASWNAPLRYLQDALAIARSQPHVAAIVIAHGTYTPDSGGGQTAGDVNAAFDLVDGVSLRGGYAGLGTTNQDERDARKFKTILSGDLLGNDGPGFINYQDNSFRVVRATNTPAGATLDGLTVTGSNWEPDRSLIGGGIYCEASILHVLDCLFELNFAYYGGAFGIVSGDARVERSVFRQNRAIFGGAINSSGLSPTTSPTLLVVDCVFSANSSGNEDGGAIAAGANTTVRRCVFSGNDADDGGAIVGRPVVEDSLFTNNHADYGGAVNRGGRYTRCRFVGNYASAAGGAFANTTPFAHAQFFDCEFVGNESGGSEDGGAAYGGGVFINCLFVSNHCGTSGGGVFATGGAIFARAPVTLVANCVFTGNTSSGAGGAIDVMPGTTVSIVNSTFIHNGSGSVGGAVSGPGEICNSIFGPHNGPPLSGVTSVDYSCLPSPPPIAGVGNIIADPRFVDPLGPDGVAGTEDDDLRLRADSPCIDAGDSTALPADQFDLDGDGDTAEPLPVDILGNRRVLFAPPHASPPDVGVPDATGAIIDMGAFEFRRPIDCAPATPPIGDGFVNIDDLLLVISGWGDCPQRPAPCLADVNADGAVNIDDLLAVVTGWG